MKSAEELADDWLLIFQKVCESYDDVPSPEEYTYGAMDSAWVEALRDFIAENGETVDNFLLKAGIVTASCSGSRGAGLAGCLYLRNSGREWTPCLPAHLLIFKPIID